MSKISLSALDMDHATENGIASEDSWPGRVVPSYAPSDGAFSEQWHLKNSAYPGMDLNVQSVWNEYRGAGIKVGVLDDGFDYKHADLAKNYSTALDYDFYSKDSDAYIDSTDKHGTAVAGVIAADDNGTGAVGVAPDATLVGYRIAFGGSSMDSFTEGFVKAAGNVDVLNNSWGLSTLFWDNKQSSALSGIFSALENLAESGRNGLGTTTIFAAGNNRSWGDDVNYHNLQNSPYAIAVGSTDQNGKYSYYSTPGAAVLVSAPGMNIYTTDNTGSAGFESGSLATVSGTSFSAPGVSGVVALMLSANKDLGYRDVQEILAYSAKNSDPSYADWQTNGGGNWNNTGLHFSHQYGFGLVDAYAAVRLAESWGKTSTYANMDQISYRLAPNLAIPDKQTISSSITVSKDIEIDHVLVSVHLSHARAGDLQLTLVSPDGTESVLMNNPGARTGNTTGSTYAFTGFEFSSVAHWGESSLGTWALKAYDRTTGTTGILKDWTITFMGDDASPNDQYVYTNEYSRAGSTILADMNGGVDTVNASAVTGNSVIDLSGETNGILAGKAFRISSGTVIENAWAGDGNDTIRGNSAGNTIHGGRGNDIVYGSAGNDILDGGAGSDTAIYSLSLGQYLIKAISAVEVSISSIANGLDKVLNFEWFSFGGQKYSIQDMIGHTGGTAPDPAPAPDPTPDPVPEAPGQAAAPVNLDFSVIKTNGTTGTIRLVSDSLSEEVLSSADLQTGTSKTDQAIVINRESDILEVTGAENLGSRLKEMVITAGVETPYDISGISAMRVNAQKASGGITMTAEDIQSAQIYTANGKDNFSIEAHNRDGNTSLNSNYFRAYLYGGDDSITVTGNNPYFRSYVDLGGGNDVYKSATTGAELIYGRDGNDTIETAEGSDRLYGHAGNDTLRAGGGNDYLYGDIGDDRLYGDAGNDYIKGDAGNDKLYGGSGNDKLYGGDGNDVLYTSSGLDSLRGDAGADTFVIADVNPGLRIEDFNIAQGDRLDIANILTGFDEGEDILANFVRLSYNTAKGVTALQVRDGASFETVAQLAGNHSNIDIQKLFDHGQIITDHT